MQFCVNAYTHLSFFCQGLTLDERGRFSGEAEKKLEEDRICYFNFINFIFYEILCKKVKILFFMKYFARKT
jgi:hypothetical protein